MVRYAFYPQTARHLIKRSRLGTNERTFLLKKKKCSFLFSFLFFSPLHVCMKTNRRRATGRKEMFRWDGTISSVIVYLLIDKLEA